MNKIIKSGFSALMMSGLLAVSAFSAYMWVSAAPVKVPLQTSQPSIGKIGLKPMDAKGKGSLSMYEWAGKPIFVKYSAAVKTLEMYAQTVNSSSKVPTWYAFDSFSIVMKNLNTEKVKSLALEQAPDANSALWQKTRSFKMPNTPLGEDEHRVLVAYVSNADPRTAAGQGIIDSVAYIVIQGETQAPVVPVVSSAELSVQSAPDDFPTQQYILGQSNQPVFKFKVVANNVSDIVLDQLPLSMNLKGEMPAAESDKLLGAIKNLRLYDGDKQVGSAVAALQKVPTGAAGIAQAVFKKLNIAIPKGTSKTLTLKVDIASYPDVFAGVQFTPSVAPLWKYTNDSPVAIAFDSNGAPAKVAGDTQTVVMGKNMQAYKTKISIAHAASAPSGAASKSSSQIVGRFVVSNANNVNNQSAEISKLKISLDTTIKQQQGTQRSLSVYKGQNPTASNLVGTYEFGPNTCLVGSSGCGIVVFDTAAGAKAMSIESGESQIYTVVFDSVDATANDSVKADITIDQWSDGVVEKIMLGHLLSLTGKQLVY